MIDYITTQTMGNATDFGNLSVARSQVGSCSSKTRGVWAGGYTDPAYSNVIDYVTIQTAGNATDFGDCTAQRAKLAGASNSIRAVSYTHLTLPTIYSV